MALLLIKYWLNRLYWHLPVKICKTTPAWHGKLWWNYRKFWHVKTSHYDHVLTKGGGGAGGGGAEPELSVVSDPLLPPAPLLLLPLPPLPPPFTLFPPPTPPPPLPFVPITIVEAVDDWNGTYLEKGYIQCNLFNFEHLTQTYFLV